MNVLAKLSSPNFAIIWLWFFCFIVFVGFLTSLGNSRLEETLEDIDHRIRHFQKEGGEVKEGGRGMI